MFKHIIIFRILPFSPILGAIFYLLFINGFVPCLFQLKDGFYLRPLFM